MNFLLSKEMEMLRKAVREFANKKIAPNVDEWDEKHHFPYNEAMLPLGELGFFGTVIPEKYDGEDMGWLTAMIVTEEIARVSSSLRVQINMQTLGCAFTIYNYRSVALAEKYVPKLVSGPATISRSVPQPRQTLHVLLKIFQRFIKILRYFNVVSYSKLASFFNFGLKQPCTELFMEILICGVRGG